MAGTLALETESLTKVFRSRWGGREHKACDGISLQVPAGSAFGLLGANGAGKTTLVKMILSVVKPTAGQARVFGRDSRIPEARRPIGYLPENHRFPTYLTGWSMLDHYAALSGLPSGERQRRIPELLDTVGLRDWAEVRLGKYSKGMLQRVGMAQALMHRPRLLILDEPTDGVDPVGRIQIRDLLQRLRAEGVSVFLNSHLLGEIETFCEHVAILAKGRVALTGKVSELTRGKGYLLTVPGLPDRLADVLAREAQVQRREEQWELLFEGRAGANRAVDLLRTAGVEIEALTQARSTLEEVFVRTLGEQS